MPPAGEVADDHMDPVVSQKPNDRIHQHAAVPLALLDDRGYGVWPRSESSIQTAGADMRMGETVLRAGQRLTTRELGVLAALGIASVRVSRRPRVAIISTGDELVPPGRHLEPGKIYDSNATTVTAAVRDNGGEAEFLGVIPDDEEALRAACERARDDFDAVILSGGTSKGAGDLSYRILRERGNVLVHGVALKPGKPVVLAVADERKPVVILPTDIKQADLKPVN